MVKHFNVMMAAIISGTVALFTSVLGVSGTIIGSVLSSFLYQLLTGYSEEKYDEGSIRKPKLANEIVYIFPLVIIAIIELIFFFSALHYRFDIIFTFLEEAVANNLFRLMGLGLIVLGAYPYFNSNNIAKRNGTVLLIVGVLLLLRGLMDVTSITSRIFHAIFAPFDMFFALFVVIALALVIINILLNSENDYFKNNEFINNHRPKKPHARKVDTSFTKRASENKNRGFNNHKADYHQDNYYHEDYHKDINPHENYPQDSVQMDRKQDAIKNQDNLPVYEEEVILVKDPQNPENTIRKRILKRVRTDNEDIDSDNYQDMYIIDESE